MNANPGLNDMTSYEFSHSGCAWCHPGGGPMEYDRQGYRYDGFDGGLGFTGQNPNVTNTSGILTTSTVKGNYYTFDPATKSIAEPSTVINQGASSPQATTTPTTAVYYKTWAQGGVAETDCLMCHFSGQYANLERAYAFPGATAPKLAASLGLVGAKGQTGLLTITRKGDYAGNPNIAQSGWSWSNNTLTGDQIVKTPNRENCTICHFPDKSWWANCATDPTNANCGPASKPFGATMFQKVIPINAAWDVDLVSTNTTTWKIAKGRVEGGKRGESLNDAGNPDAHMKTAGQGMSCSACHYTLEGSFPALKNANGVDIQPAVTVYKIDHQFAKGNNAPDGKNMDQLDNTATCASCHIDGTHPNAAGAPNPASAHAAFPAFHFEKIDCKTCHIPGVNGPVKQAVADFTAGPFQTFERTQTLEAPPGVNMKPLYLWRATEHSGGGMQIEPIMTMAVPVWANRVVNADSSISFNPTFQRMAKAAAERYRQDNGATFKLNVPVAYQGLISSGTYTAKGGAFAINTATEIAGVADIFKNPGSYWTTPPFTGLSGDPVIHFYFNQFALSHNVATRTSGKILGSPAGGGCIMCHSSSNPANENYSSKSVGFFDKNFVIFDLPTDGLQQTTVGGIQKINIKFGYKKPDGTSGTVNLGAVADGSNVGNTLNQGTVLGYSATEINALMTAGKSGYEPPLASFTWTADATTSMVVNFDAAGSICANTPCTYAWTFTNASPASASGSTASSLFSAAGTATLTVTDVNGFKNSVTQSITPSAVNAAPVAGGLGSLTQSAYTVNFTDSSSDPDGTPSVTVNWGDGTISTGAAGTAFSHTYTRPMTYKIIQTATDGKLFANVATSVSVPVKYNITGSVSGGGSTGTVYLSLLKNGRRVKFTKRTGDGSYTFTGVLPGTYQVRAYKYKYNVETTAPFVVTDADVTAPAIVLTPK